MLRTLARLAALSYTNISPTVFELYQTRTKDANQTLAVMGGVMSDPNMYHTSMTDGLFKGGFATDLVGGSGALVAMNIYGHAPIPWVYIARGIQLPR